MYCLIFLAFVCLPTTAISVMLQTLLKAHAYHGFISVDPILDKILDPTGWVTDLDRGRQAGDIELCQSLKGLCGHLSARQNQNAPVFVYTQPQNIHIATIGREGDTAVDAGPYDGFNAPYASRH